MKPEWLLYAERVRKEIDQLPAKKSGKNVERHLLMTWNEACNGKNYRGSLGDWEILIRRLDQKTWAFDCSTAATSTNRMSFKCN